MRTFRYSTPERSNIKKPQVSIDSGNEMKETVSHNTALAGGRDYVRNLIEIIRVRRMMTSVSDVAAYALILAKVRVIAVTK